MSPPSALVDDDDPGSRPGSLHVVSGFWKADVIDVLLVEDDDVDAKLINLYAAELTNPKVVIERAASVSEARTLLAKRAFDLCILDFWLGCESSLRLLAELNDREIVCPAIVLTSLSTPDIDRMCQRAGASLFIGKESLGPASLQAAILAALRAMATRPPADFGASRTGRPPMDDGRAGGVPMSACAPGFGVAETREDAIVGLLTGMLGVSDAAGGNGAACASPGRSRGGGRGPGPGSQEDAGFDRAQADLSGEPRRRGTDPRRDSLLGTLLDMTETVRFGLFEKVLTTRRPGARTQTENRIEDAGGFIASALAIARGVLDDRGQTVSFQRPEGVIAILCDPATFLFMMFELVLRASQHSASNSHVGVSLDGGASALHISLVSDRRTHAHASALAFGPLFLQVLGCCRGAIHTVSGDDGRLRLECRLDAETSADKAGRAGQAMMARNPSGWTPPGRAAPHHPHDAG